MINIVEKSPNFFHIPKVKIFFDFWKFFELKKVRFFQQMF